MRREIINSLSISTSVMGEVSAAVSASKPCLIGRQAPIRRMPLGKGGFNTLQWVLSLRYGFKEMLVFVMLLTTGCAFAQDKKPDTLDYSYLKFEDLHDYYTSMSINIIEAEDPNLYFETYAWLGTPYHWGGKSHAGLDCSGFVAKVFNRLYGTALSGAVGDIFKLCDEIQPSELKEGDFVFFNINGHYLYHMGIYLQNGKFAHAAVHGGVMVSSMDEAYYKRWFYKTGRLRQASGD